MDIVKATEGNDGVALGKMLAETGLTTLDPGYVNTGSTKSEITYIDGANGILRYRGYDIADLANKATFNEVSYLLINGELPNPGEFSKFEHEVTHHTMMHESLKNFLNGFHYDDHPMAMLAGTSRRSSAAEFVFLVGIPTMFAASGYAFLELVKDDALGSENWGEVALAFAAATATGFVVVKWLLGFIKAHRFTGFAIYRIVLGALLLLLMPAGS